MCVDSAYLEIITDNGTQFESWDVEDLCRELHIEHHFSTSGYLQGNGQAEVSNRTILTTLKKRLETAKTRCVDELPTILWAYQTTSHGASATKETTFSLAYGSETVVPVEVREPTPQISGYHDGSNQQAFATTVTLFEEKRFISKAGVC